MNLSNEQRLLLYCAQNDISENTREQVKNLIRLPLNWGEVLEASFWHGIAPLLYHNLKGLDEARSIPQDIMSHLKNAYYECLVNNMNFYVELQRVLEAFHEKGIEVIVLKGAALAKTVYGNIALRPMVDIDLMIKKEDLDNSEKVISELGYLFAGKRSPEWYKENNYHVQYFHPDKKILIEIHWHILSKSEPTPIAISDIDLVKGWWVRARALEIYGVKALILCPEDSLFYLCLHFVKHRFQSPNGGFRGVFSSKSTLIQLSDILQTIKYYSGGIDWHRLNFEAEKYRVANLIYTTFYLLREITVNNEDVLNDIPFESPPAGFSNDLVELIKNRMFDREYIFSVSPISFFYSIFAGNFHHKLMNVIRGLFPHPELLSSIYSIPLDSNKLYLYYLVYLYDFFTKNRRQISGSPSIREVKIINKWLGSD
ncbi:MAG TPA: nucleotidyltransferase family protein [Thermodesulfobacteriota bacterium]|nr:nucleotidyltransferase family protein [Thermodesulfobacteriota bacterium]